MILFPTEKTTIQGYELVNIKYIIQIAYSKVLPIGGY